jgi:hypothetical protein
MFFWSEAAVAKRLDWEKRRFDGRSKLSIKDEAEHRSNDFTNKWIKGAEEWHARVERLRAAKERSKRKRHD